MRIARLSSIIAAVLLTLPFLAQDYLVHGRRHVAAGKTEGSACSVTNSSSYWVDTFANESCWLDLQSNWSVTSGVYRGANGWGLTIYDTDTADDDHGLCFDGADLPDNVTWFGAALRQKCTTSCTGAGDDDPFIAIFIQMSAGGDDVQFRACKDADTCGCAYHTETNDVTHVAGDTYCVFIEGDGASTVTSLWDFNTQGGPCDISGDGMCPDNSTSCTAHTDCDRSTWSTATTTTTENIETDCTEYTNSDGTYLNVGLFTTTAGSDTIDVDNFWAVDE